MIRMELLALNQSISNIQYSIGATQVITYYKTVNDNMKDQ